MLGGLSRRRRTSNFPELVSSSSWLLDSSCQALALSDEGTPFRQRNFTWTGGAGHGEGRRIKGR